MNAHPIYGEVISEYSRKQAIEDGVLADVSELSKQYGIKFPVALTTGVHALCTPPKGSMQDYKGRVWDVLTMYKWAAKRGGSQMFFTVRIGRKNVMLKALCGPGDDMEPVVTILLPEED